MSAYADPNPAPILASENRTVRVNHETVTGEKTERIIRRHCFLSCVCIQCKKESTRDYGKGAQMQLIGYVIGIAVIIFVLSLVFKEISGKKTEETGDGRRTDPSEGKELHPDRMSPGPASPAESALSRPGEDGSGGEIIKPPVSGGFSETAGPKGEDSASVKKKSSSKKPKSGGRSGDHAGDEDEKKIVILYQEDTKKSRKRCPYCNTYLTSGNTICEVCGSEVSA